MFLSQQMEIKNHVFFSLINWEDLINKKITPPFNPNVVSSSLGHVWKPKGFSFKAELMALVGVGGPPRNKLADILFINHYFTHRKSRTSISMKLT